MSGDIHGLVKGLYVTDLVSYVIAIYAYMPSCIHSNFSDTVYSISVNFADIQCEIPITILARLLLSD